MAGLLAGREMPAAVYWFAGLAAVLTYWLKEPLSTA